uniref:Uncharacterized protein n=1 Tax=Avena sativa TaxID=4498 RepID=A0ACD5Y0K6_AVESA
MTDGSDVSPEVAAAGGEIWGTLEELLLACAVSRHGTASWDSVATEVQTRSPLAARPRLTPRSCRLRFHHLHRRFSVVEEAAEGQGEAEDLGASAADAWLDELRRLRVAELRREVERCDLSIGTLQSKVELMKEERERSLSGEATTKPEGNVTTGEENVSSEEPGRSCRESNSTDLKRPKRSGSVKAEEGEGEAKQEASGESMAASKESSASLCRRGRKAGGGGEEECEEAASVQQPLAALLDRVAARFGPVFERLQESQESESYRGTIRRHVDLDAMRRKLDDGGSAGYPSSELYRDLLLLCANAAVYVPRHAPEHAAAALDALRLVSAQVSASLRETTPAPHAPKREPLLIGTVTAAALADSSSRRAEAAADIVGPLIAKAAKPLIFCRKRSSIAKAAAAAAVARKDEAAEKKAGEVAKEDSDGEKKEAGVDVAAKDKAWGMRTKKTRGPGKNSAKALAKAAADEAAAATESDNNKKGDADGTAAAGGLPKKRIAVDFLKRLNQGTSTTKKRGSPLTKRKRSAPAQEEEEDQPKRRGPGRKSTGRGGSKRGGKAGTTKRSVGRPPAKRGAAPATPPPAKRAKVERSSSSSRRGGRKS